MMTLGDQGCIGLLAGLAVGVPVMVAILRHGQSMTARVVAPAEARRWNGLGCLLIGAFLMVAVYVVLARG